MTTKITEQNISNLANAGVDWQSVFTGDGSTGLTAVAGRGYFIDTTSGTVEVTLPASPSAGDVVVLKDYARTWASNNVTLTSTLFDGSTNANTFSTDGQILTIVYMDGTKGWSLINEDTTSSLGASYISATGGTVTTSGDYKIHTFTGDGCFVVSSLGANNPYADTVSYLVAAGGGGGGSATTPGGGTGEGSGAGAGGYREGKNPSDSYTASPLAAPTSLTVTATTYPITVGGGGSAGGPNGGGGGQGNNSVFSTITSAGGGAGASAGPGIGVAGGSGSGGAWRTPTSCDVKPGGSGNTPPVAPPQGNAGGPSVTGGGRTGGGGGAGYQGNPGHNIPCLPAPVCQWTQTSGGGGAGTASAISGSSVTRARGGNSGNSSPTAAGGGNSANTAFGGAGGSGYSQVGIAGASGVVIIRYKYQ